MVAGSMAAQSRKHYAAAAAAAAHRTAPHCGLELKKGTKNYRQQACKCFFLTIRNANRDN